MPFFVTLPPVMSAAVLTSIVPIPSKTMFDWLERRPPESVILPVALADVIVRSSLKYTKAWMSSAPAPDLLIATAAEPRPSSTIDPTPVVSV